MRSLLAFILFITIRISSVFIVQTYFVPDEYWQSLEVAHKITFGYGYLTWEWIQGIRSYIYPALIAGIYKILAFFNLDTVDLLILVPRIFQALISAFADYRFYVWTGKKKWAIFLMSIPWFWFYCGSRTLINTLETALTTIALSYYPWQTESSKYLWFALLSCFIRPTSAIIWVPLILYHMIKTKLPLWKLILTRFLLIGSIISAACIAVDTYFYKRFILTPFEFFKYNYLHEIGSFYGTHPWYWYFLTGLPTILGINTLPFLFAITDTIRYKDIYPTRKCLLFIIFITLTAYSLLEHKEFRFILCLLPMCLYITCETLSRWSRDASKIFLWSVAIILFIGNLVPTWYLSLIHQRGALNTMQHLSKIAQEYKSEDNQRANILFLMPCHSTPYYSHIHQNITMRFLTCEPNLSGKPNYIDEADEFYKSPNQWLKSHLPVYPKSALPTHIVLFDILSSKISEFLKEYDLIHEIPNSDYISDRTGQFIKIYERHRHVEPTNLYNEEQNNKKKDEDPMDKEL